MKLGLHWKKLAKMEVTDLENDTDERGEEVRSKDKVKHSEMNKIVILNGRDNVIT